MEKLKRLTKKELYEKKKAKAHGRRDLKDVLLPIETIVLEPAERQVQGGEALIKIGEEISEHIDRRPASLVRVRVVRPKYKLPVEVATETANAPESGIVVAEMPDRTIARSLAGPGLLAHVLVQKFADHIPLHRQEAIYKREGLKLPRSTLAGWVQGCSNLLSRVVDAMWEDARAYAPWIGVDATGVLVQQKEQCRRGHFWVVVAGRDHVLYRYTKTQSGEQVAQMLAGFSGPMIADASAVYHELYRREPGLIEVGCWAHCRRAYFDALLSDKARALVGIGFISMLYAAHTSCIDTASGEVDAAKRKALCEAILADFDAWMAAEHPKLADGTPIKKAINYTRNHAGLCAAFSTTAHCAWTTICPRSSCVEKSWGRRPGCFAAATTARIGTPPSFRSSPAARATTLNRGLTCAMCSRSCPAGRKLGSSSCRPNTGHRPRNSQPLTSCLPRCACWTATSFILSQRLR